ncbi:17-beta-hydroxysteroid dehydrogenase 14 [Saccopteryx leptura]|uniref:17-beta-hydroxysteroid dehydrogenase 14 n=1 Tax=Saccopteryx leptura TaxID=249018 RepID=UPI00339C6F4B
MTQEEDVRLALWKSQGNVINISSLVGAIGQSQAVSYVATKDFSFLECSFLGQVDQLPGTLLPQGQLSRGSNSHDQGLGP